MPRDYKTKRIAEQNTYATGTSGSPIFTSVTVTDLDGSRIVYSDSGSTLASTQYMQHNDTTHVTKLGDVDGGNYIQLASDGELTLAGTARVWKARILKPFAVKLPAANPPAEDVIDQFPFHRYDRGTEESVYYIFVLPGDFATGTASVRGHYAFIVDHPPAGGGANEVVAMGFEYKKLTEGDVFDFGAGTSSGTLYETIVAGETSQIVHKTEDGYCDTTGWVARDVILFRFYRDATDPLDTYDNEGVAANNDVWIFDYYLEYLSTGIGRAS